MSVLELGLDDKPHLSRLLLENKTLAMEVLSTFAALMEEACDPSKGVTWATLPKKLSSELSFSVLIKGILRGSLDVRQMSPGTFDALQEEVHPLAYLSGRYDALSGQTTYWNWRDHFKLPAGSHINEETIAAIIRKLWYYSRYVNIEQLSKAIQANQVATFRGIDQLPLLPMIPALRYQQEKFGDLRVGQFLSEIGSLDCGKINILTNDKCPACNTARLLVVFPNCFCPSCNAGFIVENS